MSNRLPVKITNIEYDVFDIKNYMQPNNVVAKKTVCTIILDRGIGDHPVKEMVTGQTVQDQVQGEFVETNVAAYNQAKSESYAYQDALNKIDQYGFVIKTNTQDLGY